MAQITVLKKFNYTPRVGGAVETYLPGDHEVDQEVAENWFVRAHTKEGQDKAHADADARTIPIGSSLTPIVHKPIGHVEDAPAVEEDPRIAEMQGQIDALNEANVNRDEGMRKMVDAYDARVSDLEAQLASAKAELDAEKVAHGETASLVESLTAPKSDEAPASEGKGSKSKS